MSLSTLHPFVLEATSTRLLDPSKTLHFHQHQNSVVSYSTSTWILAHLVDVNQTAAPLATVLSGSWSSRSPWGLPQHHLRATVSHVKIGCIKRTRSVSCQMLYCINKGVSSQWMESYFPGSQETLQKWQKNVNPKMIVYLDYESKEFS